MDENESEALQFLAQMLNTMAGERKGDSMVPRWWCLREDLKAHYLSEARNLISEWAASEREAENKQHLWKEKAMIPGSGRKDV